jgi:hypothetical protein
MNAKLLGSALNLSGFAQIYLVNRYTRAIIRKMEIGMGLTTPARRCRLEVFCPDASAGTLCRDESDRR